MARLKPVAPVRQVRAMQKKKESGWGVTVGLWALSLIPVAAGIARVVSVARPDGNAPDSARFLASPTPVVIHAVASIVYCLVGALQFNPSFRSRHLALHRAWGRPVMIAGFLAALSGLWMTAFYAIPAPLQGSLLVVVRLLVGVGMTAALWLSWRAILRRDLPGHRDWAVRAYALGQGAGTQVIVLLPPTLIFGQVLDLRRDLLMTLAWCINLAVAELIVRRSRRATT